MICCKKYYRYLTLRMDAQASNSIPGPSVNLQNSDGGGLDFLEAEVETSSLMGALLALVNPELYEQQLQVLEALARGQTTVSNRSLMMEGLHHWSSPFSGFALIANRETPGHRDGLGGKLLFDIVAAFGRYTQGRFEVPLLNSRFVYNPETVIVLPGGIYEHGASRTDGERICIASFIKPNVGYGALGEKYREVGPPNMTQLSNQFGILRPRRQNVEGQPT